jgi:hypothetical protein
MQNLTIQILVARERDLEAELAHLRAQLERAQRALDAQAAAERARERDVVTDMGGVASVTPPAAPLSDAEIVEAARRRAHARRLQRYG